MRTYQLVLVLKPALSDANRKKVLDTVKSWLKDGKVSKEDVWGQKPLSYPIKHEIAGYYVDWAVEGENIPNDFEKRILTNDDILRHLLLRTK
ncbi:MAG TPA: 30S ribosomal protein S6 [Candidatus Saccharimonadales bacterium]|nr:30S ribosomal protein S6 [Candidatus Saccharimonadales bacterium]